MRINKYLAQAGIASRRKVDEMIGEGRVKVNNQTAKLGDQISPTDKIEVDGREVRSIKEKLVYIMLNKPKGVVSTAAEFPNEKTVLDLVNIGSDPVKGRTLKPRLFPVGRLDKDSTGLILLTNDGELTNRLTHPKFHIPKTYEVMVLGTISDEKLSALRNGIELEDGKTSPAEVLVTSKTNHHTWLKIVLKEGRKRQIRRMASALHLHIKDLKRISIGPIKLGNLDIGKFRNLRSDEVESLKSINH